MSSHVYKKVEIVGTAETSIDDAIRNGIERAAKTLKNVDRFEVGEITKTLMNDYTAEVTPKQAIAAE